MNIRKVQAIARREQLSGMSEDELQGLDNRAYSYVLVAYTIQNAADVLTRKAAELLDRTKGGLHREQKRAAGQIIAELERAVRHFDILASSEGGGIDAVFFEVLGAESYDAIRNNAYEVIRFLMLFYTRTCSDIKATNKLGAYMAKMKSNGIFSEEEIAEFKMK